MTTVMRRRMPGMTGQAGSMARQLAGVIGGAVVYAVIRWGLLPSVNPLMAFVPQTGFFLAHLLFGLVAGALLAVTFRRRGMLGASARAGRA